MLSRIATIEEEEDDLKVVLRHGLTILVVLNETLLVRSMSLVVEHVLLEVLNAILDVLDHILEVGLLVCYYGLHTELVLDRLLPTISIIYLNLDVVLGIEPSPFNSAVIPFFLAGSSSLVSHKVIIKVLFVSTFHHNLE